MHKREHSTPEGTKEVRIAECGCQLSITKENTHTFTHVEPCRYHLAYPQACPFLPDIGGKHSKRRKRRKG